jgi:hypothetical protein
MPATLDRACARMGVRVCAVGDDCAGWEDGVGGDVGAFTSGGGEGANADLCLSGGRPGRNGGAARRLTGLPGAC